MNWLHKIQFWLQSSKDRGRKKNDEEQVFSDGQPTGSSAKAQDGVEPFGPPEIRITSQSLQVLHKEKQTAYLQKPKLCKDGSWKAELCYLVTDDIQLGKDEEVIEIIFSIESHDQGQGGDASENRSRQYSSWTFFQAAIIRALPGSEWAFKGKDTPFEIDSEAAHDSELSFPQFGGKTRWHVVANWADCSTFERHIISWTWNDNKPTDRFVNALRNGDKVALFAIARFSGQENHIRQARIDIVYSGSTKADSGRAEIE